LRFVLRVWKIKAENGLSYKDRRLPKAAKDNQEYSMRLTRRFLQLLVCFAFAIGVPASAVTEDKPTDKPTLKPADIDRLIKQLGSADFDEREAAHKKLDSIGLPALEALRAAVTKAKDKETQRRAANLVEAIENRLDYLMQLYREYDLPFPPNEAKLVRYESGGGRLVNEKPQPLTYTLGFLLEEGGKETPTVILLGTSDVHFHRHPEFTVFDPTGASSKNVDALLQDASLDQFKGLPTAIQCKARGWDELAETLLATSLKAGPQELSPKSRLYQMAWNYWTGQVLRRSQTQWANVYKQLNALLAADKTLDTEASRDLLRRLDLSLKPSNAKPGSVAALIDSLMDASPHELLLEDDHPNSPYAQLVKKGFEAVPELIEHLDDDRLTHHQFLGFNNFQPFQFCVSDVVSDVLEELAGQRLGRNGIERLKTYPSKKADAQAWWEKAKAKGEKDYLIEHVLPERDEEGWTTFPRDRMLWILVRKYPKALPSVYRTLLDKRPTVCSDPIAEAIAKGPLPRHEIRDLFVYATANTHFEHRYCALLHLKDFDEKQFIARLTETYNSLPGTPAKDYFSCREGWLAGVARSTDDEGVWRALEKAAKRADVGLRVEMLSQMKNWFNKRSTRERALRFLAAFLDDATVRDATSDKEKYESPYANWDFTHIEVRYCAAIQIATLLKLAVEMPKGRFGKEAEPWTPEQWEKFRKQVREALKRRLDAEDAKPKGKPADEEKPIK
jgi:hypothetical protein